MKHAFANCLRKWANSIDPPAKPRQAEPLVIAIDFDTANAREKLAELMREVSSVNDAIANIATPTAKPPRRQRINRRRSRSTE